MSSYENWLDNRAVEDFESRLQLEECFTLEKAQQLYPSADAQKLMEDVKAEALAEWVAINGDYPLSRKELIKVARELTGEEESDLGFQIALVLIASVMTGAKDDLLAEYTGYPLEQIRKWGDNLRAGGVWKDDGKVVGADWFEEDGTLAIQLDILVAMGIIERV